MNNLKTDMLAGHAIFTLSNIRTNKSFTYRITTAESKPHFVSVLTGPDNYEDYTFIGTIFEGETFRHNIKGGITKDAQSVKAFEWLWRNLGKLPDFVRVDNCGYCFKCGKLLTTTQSIMDGYGPTCIKTIQKEKVTA